MPVFTIYAVYCDNHQKYSDSVEAETWQEAEQVAQDNCCGNLIIAAIVDEDHNIVDI